jgi:hypothetical protein
VERAIMTMEDCQDMDTLEIRSLHDLQHTKTMEL